MSEQDAPNPNIVEVTRDTFDRDVFDRSRDVPVVVDFWASWCAPCRMLGPLLEKLAEEYDGKFVLAKADTEAMPDAAAAFKVQSIPAVYAVSRGSIVDSFVGVLPETQIREWLDKVICLSQLEEAKELEEQQPLEAEKLYRAALQQQPKNAEAQIGLARTLLARESVEEVGELLVQLESRGFLEPEAEKLKAQLAMHAKQGLDVDAARAAAEAEPDNLQLQLALAEALSGAGEHQQAMDVCLTLVERDRSGAGESAREMMLEIFRVLPDGSELTRDYRRKLSMLLY